tara:strand:+ start:168 stop:668 length:501 start_codon:yes stop_codon:yes gene_type:complete
MQNLIKQGAVVHDDWTLVKEATDPTILDISQSTNLIVPIKFWNMHKSEIESYLGKVTIWLDSDEFLDEINEELNTFSLIALNFPVFSDGRPYTTARHLRQRGKFLGEIRAIGDVLRDQIFYMSQCGFNSFLLRHDQDPDSCIRALKDFKANYQSTVLEENPLFRRR